MRQTTEMNSTGRFTRRARHSFRICWALGCCLTLISMAVSESASAFDGEKYTDPAKVDEDYAFQGEYVGDIDLGNGPERFGIQVIALGKGKFDGLAFPGGLPGDGWTGAEPLVPSQRGVRQGDKVVFDGEMTATIKDTEITLQTADGIEIGFFKKADRKSKTLGAKPPEGAVVLFDGKDAEHWENGRMTDDGLLMEGTTSKETFGSHQIHIEFRLPYQPDDRGQARGNSGIYVQGRYEVQMLDSFGLSGEQNECGGIYSVAKPKINMCYPPLTWQTYDITYTAAKYDDAGKLTKNPHITVLHNGVKIHDDVELPGERNTTAAPLAAGNSPGPVYLQNHGCPVRYRNIWVLPLDENEKK